MSLSSFSGGINTSLSSELNDMYEECLTQAGLNTIRIINNGGFIFSSGDLDGYGEAYSSSSGTLGIVKLFDQTDATFSSNQYTTAASSTSSIFHQIPSSTFSSTISKAIGVPLIDNWESGGDITYKLVSYTFSSLGTTHDPNSFTNASNAFDEDSTTYADKDFDEAADVALGKTFSATTITYVYVHTSLENEINTQTVKLQSYNGSTWSDIETLLSDAGTINQFVYVGSSVQGLRLLFGTSAITGTISAKVYRFDATTVDDDTGWLNAGVTPTVSSFSAFSTAPQFLIVKLTPKGSPTAAYPSIRGFWVRAI